MVYRFDPKYVNETIFLLDEWQMSPGWMEYIRENKPIPASYFPKSLTVKKASKELPDIFRPTHSLIIFSEKARIVLEEWAPGQIDFIPVILDAAPEIVERLKLASTYYFINVLGRAQQLQWLEMPVRAYPQEDGTTRFGNKHDFRQWKLRERAAGAPLIWHESIWRTGSNEYRGHTEIFVEDTLWKKLDANFPDQLNAQWVGR